MKNTNKRYAKYLKEFECIGGKCEDSCCVGWDIDIDKVTFKQYYKVKDVEMKKMFQKNVHNNEYCSSDDVDYGKVKLKAGKRCAFLDEENYCMIYSKIGEEYLSNVCTCFPRILNKVDGCHEKTLDVSCPEAARIILLKEEGIEFEDSFEVLGKHIIASDIDTKAKQFNNSPVKYFKEIREVSIKIIKNRKFDLSQRLYILGEFMSALEEEIEENYKNVPRFIKQYNINSVREDYENNKMNYIIQMDFFKRLLKLLNVFKELDSLSFKEYTKQMQSGFKLEDVDYMSKNSKVYIEAFEDYTEKYINENSYIFENYLVNFMYNNMFPFTENESVFDGYIMLLIRYSFVRFYLVGRYLNNQEDSKKEIVEFIQVFSKVVGHHKSYLVDVLKFVKGKEFNNIEFTKTLV